ncbi:HET-domain-containing protein [Eremomyces bilateralis CBS 781.70]|uniref:HET-domain-containing protein n=1 Tax=Eremomyces bilateralis CBS 781.70 TaxID=1392243 RepID=A0A6G1FTZ2_9PEZI|nr:HET-domain-containing protein [Eremomyces bilateralis CBS 781.70]KAF1809210.1 HET-domain-containing protein [Eremomyces bilateralis CBS 781.70]
MRLLSTGPGGSFSLHCFTSNIPSYAILSHTWEADDQEVTFQDIMNAAGTSKTGYRKIEFCKEQAEKNGLQYFWVDSCCIDKSSSAELTEAINSMFRWYQDAAKCYVYLSDVSTGKHTRSSKLLWEPAFRQGRWFTRGWTLQELLAPRSVEFFSRDGKRLGNKDSLEQQIHKITGIAIDALRGHLSQFSDEERMAWAEKRETTKEEDQAYCLMGIFDVSLPVIYGEGKRKALQRLREAIDKRSGDTQVEWNNKERDCMQALRTSASDYEQFKERNSSRLRDTCQWVLHHKNFRNWKDSSSSSLLWISADPGCGKSVFSKSLVDEDLKNMDARTTYYFFFKDDDDVQKSAVTALAALLHQLFRRKPTLIKHAISDFAANGHQLSQSFHTLWGILIKTVADRNAGEVFCVLDALDECTKAGQYQIINALSSFYQQASSGNDSSRLKICITSRPYPDIERRFTDLTSNFPTIRLHGEQESDEISREIDLVIKWRVSQLGSELKLNNLEQSNLEIELLRMSHRTYLWVTLIFDIIRKMIRPTSRKLKAVISNLPSTVDEAYEAILTKIEEDDRPQARKLLYIVVGATRPLTLKEMNIALAIEDRHRSYDDLKPDLDDKARFEASVTHLCGLFVTVVDRTVYLIHQTAKEFLLAKSEAAAIGWKHSLHALHIFHLLNLMERQIRSLQQSNTTT